MRIVIRLLLFILVLAVVLTLLNLWAGRYLSNRIDQFLQHELQLGQHAKISYSALHLNPARARLAIKDLQLSDSTMQARTSRALIGLSYTDVAGMFARGRPQIPNRIEQLHIQAGSLEIMMPETIAGQLYIERLQARGSVDLATTHPRPGADASTSRATQPPLLQGLGNMVLDLHMEALLWTPPATLADAYGLLFTLFELPETELPVRRITVPMHWQNDTLRVDGGTLESVAFDAQWQARMVATETDGWKPALVAVTLVRLSDETEQFVSALEQLFQVSLPRKNGLLHLEIDEGRSNLGALPGAAVPPF